MKGGLSLWGVVDVCNNAPKMRTYNYLNVPIACCSVAAIRESRHVQHLTAEITNCDQ
jgi:hypothetical protein